MDLSLTLKQKLIVTGIIIWMIGSPILSASIVFPELFIIGTDMTGINDIPAESDDAFDTALDIGIILGEVVLVAVKILLLKTLYKKFRLGAAIRNSRNHFSNF